MKIIEESGRGPTMLLSVVVAKAIRDACLEPIRSSKNKTLVIQDDAYTAFRFLFDTSEAGVDAYADWLDFDVDKFRRKLMEVMHNDSAQMLAGLSSEERRRFRINRTLWDRMKQL
jgi:hypothetical protein